MIRVCEPLLTPEDISAVTACLSAGWVSSTGPYIEQFESGWARLCGMPHGIAVSSGTAALEIAFQLIELKPGDEVIMPSFTIISCAQAVTKCGATPVLVDCDPYSWQMNVNQVEQKLSDRTKAILAVHIYGHPVDMDPLLELARSRKIPIFEDAAEAHGAQYKGMLCGGLGDLSAFSFYANKIITTGEGGMLLTNNEAWAERARSKRNLCFQAERRFLHDEIGSNFRLTNMQAALGISQMSRLKQIVSRKCEVAATYRELLSDLDVITFQQVQPWAEAVFWVVGIVIDEKTGKSAEVVSRELASCGIETRPFFLGIHQQPVFQRAGLFHGQSYPVTERLARQGLYLPNGLAIGAEQIVTICDCLRRILRN